MNSNSNKNNDGNKGNIQHYNQLINLYTKENFPVENNKTYVSDSNNLHVIKMQDRKDTIPYINKNELTKTMTEFKKKTESRRTTDNAIRTLQTEERINFNNIDNEKNIDELFCNDNDERYINKYIEDNIEHFENKDNKNDKNEINNKNFIQLNIDNLSLDENKIKDIERSIEIIKNKRLSNKTPRNMQNRFKFSNVNKSYDQSNNE